MEIYTLQVIIESDDESTVHFEFKDFNKMIEFIKTIEAYAVDLPTFKFTRRWDGE